MGQGDESGSVAEKNAAMVRRSAVREIRERPSLSADEVRHLVAWVDGGAPLGDPKQLPPPKKFVEGWAIPKPDMVFQLPKPFPVPATGVMEYQYVIIPTGFTKDTWVEHVQAAPTDYSVVHHIVAYVRAPGSSYFAEMPRNEFFEAPPAKGDAPRRPRTTCRTIG